MNSEKSHADKRQEFRRVFAELPNVFIQDPARQCAYYIPSSALARFQTSPDSWLQLSASTVTFVIQDGDVVEEVPPFLSVDAAPSVHIQYPSGKASYFIPFEELQQFRTALGTEFLGSNSISFIIPQGLELVEEIPSVVRALLQSNTSAVFDP